MDFNQSRQIKRLSLNAKTPGQIPKKPRKAYATLPVELPYILGEKQMFVYGEIKILRRFGNFKGVILREIVCDTL